MAFILGVDIGLTGGLALLDGETFIVEPMPVMRKEGKTFVKMQVNAAAFSQFLREWNKQPVPPSMKWGVQRAYVERVATMPKQGVAGQGSLMHSFGVIEGVLAALGIPMVLVSSQEWKKYHGLLGSDKDAARTLAQRLYPTLDLSKKKDIGLADALLIARYGQYHYGLGKAIVNQAVESEHRTTP